MYVHVGVRGCACVCVRGCVVRGWCVGVCVCLCVGVCVCVRGWVGVGVCVWVGGCDSSFLYFQAQNLDIHYFLQGIFNE